MSNWNNISNSPNSFVNNGSISILRQTDAVCFHSEDGKRCKNEFQEKCNSCQYMFCKVHLRVSERYFICENCCSIANVQREVNARIEKCYQCAWGPCCCCTLCTSPFCYCCWVSCCLPKWSMEAHDKYRMRNVPHLKCQGFKANCGCSKVACTGHGPIQQTFQEEQVPLNSSEGGRSQVEGVQMEQRSGGGGGGNKNKIVGSPNVQVNLNGSSNNETYVTDSPEAQITGDQQGVRNLNQVTGSAQAKINNQGSSNNENEVTGSEGAVINN